MKRKIFDAYMMKLFKYTIGEVTNIRLGCQFLLEVYTISENVKVRKFVPLFTTENFVFE